MSAPQLLGRRVRTGPPDTRAQEVTTLKGPAPSSGHLGGCTPMSRTRHSMLGPGCRLTPAAAPTCVSPQTPDPCDALSRQPVCPGRVPVETHGRDSEKPLSDGLDSVSPARATCTMS